MPESDVTKMKVADLKRELKLRGLPLNGNKNELQDRLQTALLEGDISLEDSAIADAIDDDVSFTDEDEHKLLSDEHEDMLLKSPVSTPIGSTLMLPKATMSSESRGDTDAASLPAKKIVLKRNNSVPQSATMATPATLLKENAVPATEASGNTFSDSEEKITKSVRKPIVVGSALASDKDAATGNDKKLSELSIKERLELRAKKFGITIEASAKPAPADTAVVNKSSSASIKANKGNKETEEQQKEALKRRAERFGCIVPEKTAKTLVEERLQKRKDRFGGVENAKTTTASNPKEHQGAWADKARARLERFKATSTETTN